MAVPRRTIDPYLLDFDLKFVHCPISASLRVLGKKWTLLILRDVGFRRIDRFNRLLESVKGITPRMLSMRIRELEKEGFIERAESNRSPMFVRWRLTKKGKGTYPILLSLLSFGTSWYAEEVLEDGKARTIKELFPDVPRVVV